MACEGAYYRKPLSTKHVGTAIAKAKNKLSDITAMINSGKKGFLNHSRGERSDTSRQSTTVCRTWFARLGQTLKNITSFETLPLINSSGLKHSLCQYILHTKTE